MELIVEEKGVWCPVCQMPSAVRQVAALHFGPRITSILDVARCTNIGCGEPIRR